MSLSPEQVKKIAHLARLTLNEKETSSMANQLSHILTFIEQINQEDTSNVTRLAHPLDLSQRMRDDEVTEPNQRDKFQRIAPQVEAGLYLVPKVIDEG